MLNRVHGVQPELAGAGHVLCITTIGNVDADMDRLAVRPETVLTPREAFFAADQAVPLRQASGRVAAKAITPYPPGIPLVMRAERLDDDVIALLSALRDAGNPITHRIRRWKWCSRSAERDLSSGGWAPSGRPA